MKPESTSIGASILAGGLAGASETVVTYPAEFVKTRRQLSTNSLTTKPQSSLSILRTTLKNNGLQGIYSGCQTLAISNALKSGVRFFSFEAAKRHLTAIFSPNSTPGAKTTSANPWINLGAGLCAGVTESVLVVTPGEYLKTVVIHDAAMGGRLGQQSLFQIIGQAVRQNGVLSLWRGLVPVVCKQGTNSAVRFTTFGVMRDKLRQTWPEKMSDSASTFIAGAGSGVITVYASMPFDNVKTRMQSLGGSGQRMISVAANMLATEGVKVFWRATTPRLVRLTLSSSITFTVYDLTLRTIDSFTSPRAGGKILM